MLPDKNIEVSYGQMLACVAAQLDLTTHQDMKRLEARLKQLRSKAQIPPQGARNLGPNARYDFSELWKLCFVFAMVDLSVDTLRAAMIISFYWQTIDVALADAWISRETHANDPIFVEAFPGLIDGFTKLDKPLDWIRAEGLKQQSQKPLPLIWVDRMSVLFSTDSAGRFPPNQDFRPRVGCTLINLTALAIKIGSIIVEKNFLSFVELDEYFLDIRFAADKEHGRLPLT